MQLCYANSIHVLILRNHTALKDSETVIICVDLTVSFACFNHYNKREFCFSGGGGLNLCDSSSSLEYVSRKHR